jgi:mRNA-degrading endonuclease RelE of RelBE toxin-antitoxin system
MSDLLLVYTSDLFIETLNKIPRRFHNPIKDILKNITRDDIEHNKFVSLEGNYRYLRKFRKGNYRVFFIYCGECYRDFDAFLKCDSCDPDNIERIIAFCVYKRKNSYRKVKNKFIPFNS